MCCPTVAPSEPDRPRSFRQLRADSNLPHTLSIYFPDFQDHLPVDVLTVDGRLVQRVDLCHSYVVQS